MYVGRVACCPLVSNVEYAPRALFTLEKTGRHTNGRTDGRIPDCYTALIASVIMFPFSVFTLMTVRQKRRIRPVEIWFTIPEIGLISN